MSRHPAGGIAVLLSLIVGAATSSYGQTAGTDTPVDVTASSDRAAPPSAEAPVPQADVAPSETRTPAPAKPAAVKPRVHSAARPAAPKPPALASIEGRLELVAGQKQTIDAGEAADGLVYFLPKAGNPKPRPGYFTVNTHSKGFSPSLLVVPVGSTLNFPNRDTVLHNVFSRTPGTSFDFGNYGPGQSRQQVFAKPGLVIVNCSVHHSMRATVLVMATPYYTRPDRNGRFTLEGLPPGAGTLVYWHPRAAATTAQIVLPNATKQRQRLVVSKPRSDHDGMR